MFTIPEQFRIHDQIVRADATTGSKGAFFIPRQQTGRGKFYLCIAVSTQGWEHVSVSIPSEKRTPTWEEMCYIKSLFWQEEDAVVQLHPPKSQYVDMHPYCLHLWRPTEAGSSLPDPLANLWTVFQQGTYITNL